MAKKRVKHGVTNEKIMGVLLDMDERMATKYDLERVKNNLEEKLELVKDELMREIQPISDAVDVDAETIVSHGKRIVVLERKAGVVTK